MAEGFVRILQCFECRTMEVLPDYEGDTVFDSTLQYIDEKHGGQTQMPHHRALHRVETKHWDNIKTRRRIVDEMWKGQEKLFRPSYYDIKDTLLEDAVKCFRAHGTPDACIDYRDGSKIVGNPAAQDRARLAREMRNDDIRRTKVRIFLCDFCPYQRVVERKKFEMGEA